MPPDIEPSDNCATCGDTGRVAAFVPLFPQIDSKACPDCKPDHRLCICCGESSPGDDCPTCDERREARGNA